MNASSSVTRPELASATPLTIALFTDDCLPASTPAGDDVQRIARELTHRGHHVVVIARRHRGQAARQKSEGIKIYRLWSWPLLGLYRTALIKNILRKDDVQVVHLHFSGPSLWQSLVETRQLGLHTVFTAQLSVDLLARSWWLRPFRGLMRKHYFKLLENVDDVICPDLVLARQIVTYTAHPQVHHVAHATRLQSLQSAEPSALQAPTTDAFPVLIDQLEAIYRRSRVDPSTPGGDAHTRVRVATRRVCNLCGLGTLATARDSVVLSSDERGLANAYFRMWRCPGCLSMHTLARVSVDEFKPHLVFQKRTLNRFNRPMFKGFYDFMRREGLERHHRVLLYGLNANLFRQVFQEQGQSHVDYQEELPTDELPSAASQALYDAVVIMEFLECAEDPKQVFAYARRQLKPGGLLVVHTPDAEHIQLQPSARQRLYQPHRIHIFSRRIFTAMVRREGFQPRSIHRRNYMDTPWPFINFSAFQSLVHFGDGTVDAAIEFRFGNLLRAWWNLPQWLFWGFFGGILRDRSNMIAVCEKTVDATWQRTPDVIPESVPARSHYRAIFLSPHLDDAVFSCGGRIASLVKEGPILAVNLFTDFSHPPPWTHVILSEERIKENDAAGAQLGFESVLLNQPDCVCRSARYLAPSRLFGGEPQPEDLALLPELRLRLEQLLNSVTWDALYIPLGVGWHVDHVLCYRATKRFHLDARTWFYEDMPYALIPHALDRRLSELGFAADSTIPERSSWVVDGWQAGREVAKSAIFRIIPAPVREPLGRLLGGGFFAFYYLRRQRRKVEERSSWRVEEQNISDLWPQKKSASFLYESQILEFFNDRESWEAHSHRYMQSLNSWNDFQWTERYWQKTQTPEDLDA